MQKKFYFPGLKLIMLLICVSRSFGFPNNFETYGLISGLWTSTFALGAFIGPSIAGILLDNIGFRNGSMFIVLLHMLVVCFLIHFIYNIYIESFGIKKIDFEFKSELSKKKHSLM